MERAVIATGTKTVDPLRDLGGSDEEEEPFWPWLQRELEKGEPTEATHQMRTGQDPGADLEFTSQDHAKRQELERAFDACFVAVAQSEFRESEVEDIQMPSAVDGVSSAEDVSNDGAWLFAGLAGALWNGARAQGDERKRRTLTSHREG